MYQDIGGLQVAVNDGFLMRVLHAVAGLDEELHPLPYLQSLLIAIIRDRQSRHVLHDEVRLSLRRGTGIEDLGNGRMIHDGERLAFGLEALHHRLVVHAGLDQLQRHRPQHRRDLLRQPHLTHAALAQLADEPKSLCKDLAGRQTRPA
jgi:hypothetical protein